MAPRSRRLVDPSAVGDVGAVVYTAPAGSVVLVKGIRAVNTSEAAVDVSLCVNAVAPENAVWWALQLEPGQHLTDDSWWVLESGDELWAIASDPDVVTLMVSGAELGG